jgi:hypothetical protein
MNPEQVHHIIEEEEEQEYNEAFVFRQGNNCFGNLGATIRKEEVLSVQQIHNLVEQARILTVLQERVDSYKDCVQKSCHTLRFIAQQLAILQDRQDRENSAREYLSLLVEFGLSQGVVVPNIDSPLSRSEEVEILNRDRWFLILLCKKLKKILLLLERQLQRAQVGRPDP